MAGIGGTDYRTGALERLAEALLLLRQQRFGGSAYLAGRAVEGMLRAVIWKSDPDYASGKKSLETGHSLRDMLKLVRSLGMKQAAEDFYNACSAVIRRCEVLWHS